MKGVGWRAEREAEDREKTKPVLVCAHPHGVSHGQSLMYSARTAHASQIGPIDSWPGTSSHNTMPLPTSSATHEYEKKATSSGAFAERVAGYRRSQAKPNSTWGRWGTKGTSFDVYMRTRDPIKMTAAALLLFSGVMMIAAVIMKRVFNYSGEGPSELDIGYWRWSARVSTPALNRRYEGDACNDAGWVAIAYGNLPPLTEAFKNTECYNGMEEKCNTSKAFSVVGILCNVVAMLVLFAPTTSFAITSCLLSAFAGVSYIICFAISVRLYTGEKVIAAQNDRDSSECGLDWAKNDDMTLGVSFILAVVASILCFVSSILALISKRESDMVVPEL